MNTKKINFVVDRYEIMPVVLFLFLWLSFTSSVSSQDFWQKTNGPGSGSIHCIAVDPNGILFIGTNRGVFRSMDNRNNWTQVKQILSSRYNSDVYCIAINSVGHIIIGTRDGGVLRSTDNGDNWIPINNGLTSTFVSSLAINDSGHVFAADGVFRSTDNGNTCTQVNNGLLKKQVLSLAISDSGHIFAGINYGGLYRSNDNGENWTRVDDN